MTFAKIIALAGLATVCGACAPPSLQHVGYTNLANCGAGSNKVWYHWVHGNGAKHSIVVCDVQPNGSETNCKETDI